MGVEVVAVRWSCWACEATVITGPGSLPSDWFEWPAPPWRADNSPRHCCPDHAAEGRDLHRAQWGRVVGRTVEVSAEEYEAVRVALRGASHRLERLKLSAERASDRKM